MRFGARNQKRNGSRSTTRFRVGTPAPAARLSCAATCPPRVPRTHALSPPPTVPTRRASCVGARASAQPRSVALLSFTATASCARAAGGRRRRTVFCVVHLTATALRPRAVIAWARATATCSVGFELKANGNTLLCGAPSSENQSGCSDAICCVAMPSCSGYQCPAGFQVRDVNAEIFCSGVCQRDTCCAAQGTSSPETAAVAGSSGFFYFFAAFIALLFLSFIGAMIYALRRKRGRAVELQSETQPDEGDKCDDNEAAILVATTPLVVPTASSVAPSSVSDVSDNEAQREEDKPNPAAAAPSNPTTPTSTLQTAQRTPSIPRLYGIPSHSTLSKGRRRSNTASFSNSYSAPLSRTPTLGCNTPPPLIPRTNTPRTNTPRNNTPRTSTPRSVPTKSPPRRRDSVSGASPSTLVATASESTLRPSLSARRRGSGFPYSTQA
eukprot:Rhum_TRINITY_DN21481_c0_g1::Rhum_TRINITY_DN21481_c0_g1_i1::g.174132::m.174132